MNKKEEFQNLADKLVSLGENREAFDFWTKIFDDLPEDKQLELIALMLGELSRLQDNRKT